MPITFRHQAAAVVPPPNESTRKYGQSLVLNQQRNQALGQQRGLDRLFDARSQQARNQFQLGRDQNANFQGSLDSIATQAQTLLDNKRIPHQLIPEVQRLLEGRRKVLGSGYNQLQQQEYMDGFNAQLNGILSQVPPDYNSRDNELKRFLGPAYDKYKDQPWVPDGRGGFVIADIPQAETPEQPPMSAADEFKADPKLAKDYQTLAEQQLRGVDGDTPIPGETAVEKRAAINKRALELREQDRADFGGQPPTATPGGGAVTSAGTGGRGQPNALANAIQPGQPTIDGIMNMGRAGARDPRIEDSIARPRAPITSTGQTDAHGNVILSNGQHVHPADVAAALNGQTNSVMRMTHPDGTPIERPAGDTVLLAQEGQGYVYDQGNPDVGDSRIENWNYGVSGSPVGGASYGAPDSMQTMQSPQAIAGSPHDPLVQRRVEQAYGPVSAAANAPMTTPAQTAARDTRLREATNWLRRNPGQQFNAQQVQYLQEAGFDDAAIAELQNNAVGQTQLRDTGLSSGLGRERDLASRANQMAGQADSAGAAVRGELDPYRRQVTDPSGPYAQGSQLTSPPPAPVVDGRKIEEERIAKDAKDRAAGQGKTGVDGQYKKGSYTDRRQKKYEDMKKRGVVGEAKTSREVETEVRKLDTRINQASSAYRSYKKGGGTMSFSDWAMQTLNPESAAYRQLVHTGAIKDRDAYEQPLFKNRPQEDADTVAAKTAAGRQVRQNTTSGAAKKRARANALQRLQHTPEARAARARAGQQPWTQAPMIQPEPPPVALPQATTRKYPPVQPPTARTGPRRNTPEEMGVKPWKSPVIPTPELDANGQPWTEGNSGQAPTVPATQAGSGARAKPNFGNLKSKASDNEDKAFIGYMEELYKSPLKPSIKDAISVLVDANATAEEVSAAKQHLIENGIDFSEAFPNRSVAKQQAQMTAF